MAYNKITSHFSSSKVFTNDKYFSWNNSTNQGEFIDFIDFKDNTSSITASFNNLFITGNIKHKNNITSSLFRLENNAEINLGSNNNFLKNSNGNISISSNQSIELTGSVSGQKTLAKDSITGSLINVDSSGNKLVTPIAGMSVSVVNEETTNLDRFVLSPANDTLNNTGITYFHFLAGNVAKSLVCTGSTVVEHYQNGEADPSTGELPGRNLFRYPETFYTSGQEDNLFIIDLERLTEEHKNYMKQGKFHIMYFMRSKDNGSIGTIGDRSSPPYAIIYLPDDVFSIGSTIIMICGNIMPDIKLPTGNTSEEGSQFLSNNSRNKLGNSRTGHYHAVRSDFAGTSYVLKKIENNKWTFADTGN